MSSSVIHDCLAEPPAPRAPEIAYFIPLSHFSFDTTVILISTLLGILNFAVHLSWKTQFRGLVGQNGLSPAIITSNNNFAAKSSYHGIFGKLSSCSIRPTNSNMNRVIIVGMIFGIVQVAVGMFQLFFACRRDFVSSSSSSSSICSSSLISNFIFGTSSSSSFSWRNNNNGINDATLLRQFLLECLSALSAGVIFTPWFCSGICFVTYFSLRETAGRFMGLQMHAKVLELNFWFALLSFCENSFATAFALQFFCLRLMVGGGIGKLTGSDPSWTKSGNYTAMCYHYFTMPLPNPLSRWFHHLPYFVHRLEVQMTLLVEGPLGLLSLVLPFWHSSVFHALRVVAFLGNFLLLFGINISGNFGHLWLASIAAACASLDDVHLSWIFPTPTRFDSFGNNSNNNNNNNNSSSNIILYYFEFIAVANKIRWYLGILVSTYYCTIQLVPFAETWKGPLPSPFHDPIENFLLPLLFTPLNFVNLHVGKKLNLWSRITQHADFFAAYGLCNVYVKFANMTKFRHEIIIQAKPKETGSQWIDIPFKYKPWSADDTPRFAPLCHMPSLDWFLWFIPLQLARTGARTTVSGILPNWFVTLLEKIRDQDSDDVLDLIDRRKLVKELYPFSKENPPVCVRAVIYEFIYSTVAEIDLETGIPRGGEIEGISGKKLVGIGQRVGRPYQGKWWRKQQIGHQSIIEV